MFFARYGGAYLEFGAMFTGGFGTREAIGAIGRVLWHWVIDIKKLFSADVWRNDVCLSAPVADGKGQGVIGKNRYAHFGGGQRGGV